MNIIIFTSTCLSTSSGSVDTTLNILNNLPESFKVNLVLVDSLVPEQIKSPAKNAESIINHPKIISVKNLENLSIEALKRLGDKAIIAIYNFLGEDGILPALCALCGIKILSTSFSSSAICFDKNWTKQIMISEGLTVPKGKVFNLNDSTVKESVLLFFNECDKKIIIKPVTCGASRGCTVCTDAKQIDEAIDKVRGCSDQVLCEEFIGGREYTIGFIHQKGKLKILPPVEIITDRDFFDYHAKYEDIKTKDICPAETLSPNTLEEVQGIVRIIIKVFKIESHARIDFIISQNKIYVLEVNTFPGLMENSLFPKELRAANISMADFILDSFSRR